MVLNDRCLLEPGLSYISSFQVWKLAQIQEIGKG